MNTQTPLFEPEVLPKPLKVFKIDIDQVMGLEEFDLEPGPHWNIVQGPNGAGKTSALEAVKNVFAGGSNLANLARINDDGTVEEPRVVIILKGEGLEEYQLTKTAKGLTIKERVGNSAAFKPIDTSPGEWLRKMFDAQRCSPAKFLMAKDTDQLSMFLEALPVKMNVERVKEIVGRFWTHVEKSNLSWEWLHAIQALAAIRQSVYNARTGVNTSYDAKRKAAQEDLLDIPAEIPTDLPEQIAAKRAEIEVAAGQYTAETANIASTFRAAEAAADAEYDAAISAAKIRHDNLISEAKEAANVAKLNLADQARALDKAKAELADLDRAGREVVQMQTKRDTAARREAEAASLKGEVEAMTSVLNGLDLYKEEMASIMPIKGLTVDGGLKINGVPFASCNTAARVSVAFQVGLFGAQRLRAIFIDGMEALDAESQAEFKRLAVEHDVQLFGAEVKDSGALSVDKA